MGRVKISQGVGGSGEAVIAYQVLVNGRSLRVYKGQAACCEVAESVPERHLFVQASFWTVLKTYSTDAAGVSRPVYRGACRFGVGETERHQVMIEVDGLARVNAYVDGELVEANLFARLRAVIFSSVAFFVALVLVLALAVSAMVLKA